MHLQVPTEILRGFEAHRSKKGSHRRYPRELQSAAVAWARPLLSEYSIQTLASNLGIGWDTLNAWLSSSTPPVVGRPRDRSSSTAKDAVFLPVQVTKGPEPEVESAETMVDIVVRGGRTIRLRWPVAQTVIIDVITAVESLI